MRKGWTETTLGDVAEWFSGGTPKAGKPEFYEGGDIPWVVIADLMKTEVYETATCITPAGLSQIGGRLAPVGSVLISMYATVGRPGIALVPVATNQAIAWSIPNSKLIESRFLLLVAQSLEVEISSMARGATQRNINRAMLREFKFLLPPPVEQKRIVDVVSSVDAYIDALQQQADTARNLFSSVCAEVFSANENLENLSDIASVVMGQSPEGSTCNVDGIGTPLLTGPTEFNRYVVGPPRQWTEKETKISNSGDILFCVRGATAGRINIAGYKSVIGRGLAAIRCSEEVDTNFVRYALITGLPKLLPNSGGTIFPNISQSQLREFQTFWPDQVKRRAYSQVLKSIEDVVYSTEQAVVGAKALRSGLLSDLLSGNHEIPASYDSLLGAA